MLDTSSPPSRRLSCRGALRPRRAPDPILVVAVEHEMVRPRPYPTVQIHSVPMRSEAPENPFEINLKAATGSDGRWHDLPRQPVIRSGGGATPTYVGQGRFWPQGNLAALL